MSVTVRPARLEDCEELARFRERMEGGRVLARLRGPEFYRHKYIEVGVAAVADDGGRIVGMTAGTPRRVTIRGRTVGAADLGDLFIDPSYRGQGLFRRLHEVTLEGLLKRGVQLVTVQPGPPAVAALRAFGYLPLFPITEWVGIVDRKLALQTAPTIWRHLLLRALPLLTAEPASPEIRVDVGTAVGLKGLSPSDKPWPQATTLRDAAWLETRYGHGPTPYEAAVAQGDGAATVVFLVQQPLPSAPARGWLVDGWAVGREAGRLVDAVVTRVVAEFRARDVAIAHTWSAQGSSTHDPLVQAIRRTRFVRQPQKKQLLVWTAPGAGTEYPPGSGWMFRMGDTDGI